MPVLPELVPGRVAKASTHGVGSDYTVSFSGGPPQEGSWVVAFIYTDNNATAPFIGGGTYAWDEAGENGPTAYCYVHRCNSLEPSNYTIAYTGASKAHSSGVVLLELVSMSPANPDESSTNTLASEFGGTPLISVSNRTILVGGAITERNFQPSVGSPDTLYYGSPPAGYTVQGSLLISPSTIVACPGIVVATKPNNYGHLEPGDFWQTPLGSSYSSYMTHITLVSMKSAL